jgi:hypothetical protein
MSSSSFLYHQRTQPTQSRGGDGTPPRGLSAGGEHRWEQGWRLSPERRWGVVRTPEMAGAGADALLGTGAAGSCQGRPTPGRGGGGSQHLGHPRWRQACRGGVGELKSAPVSGKRRRRAGSLGRGGAGHTGGKLE